MHVFTAAEMRACDERTVERYGETWKSLMENAGAAVAKFVMQQFPDAGRITVLCGKGNNGGDGMIAARHLHASGKQARIVLLGMPEQLQAEARAAYEQLPHALRQSALLALAEQDTATAAFDACMTGTDLFLDAVFGTGFHPPLRGPAVAVRNMLAAQTAPVVSVDLPSGWDADSMEMNAAEAFRSNAVVTFTAPKLAHVFGGLTRGPVVVAPIGSPEEAVVSASELSWTGASKKIIEQPRALDSNKGRFGHVLVIGGSPGKAGAASMASLAAMRAGAGLVTAAIPQGVASIVAGFAPEMMTLLLEQSAAGGISPANLDPRRLEAMLRGMTVLAIGPGIGRAAETAEFVRELVCNTKLPTVLDADGLNAFEGRNELLDGNKRALVLTPHPGEMARLLGTTVAEVEGDRLATARKFATEHRVTLVLKGWRTLVAHPDGRIAVNTSGNPAMAKGGSGDLLTGMVAALVAQFPQSIPEAVECAVWLHGACADLFMRTHDEHTMLATDMLRHVSEAIRKPVAHDSFTWIQEGRR
ncbi:MAG: NAD(P)H-hydrate dehydratase [Acidobacteriaceae bacterium]